MMGQRGFSVCGNASKRHLSWRHFSALLLLLFAPCKLLITNPRLWLGWGRRCLLLEPLGGWGGLMLREYSWFGVLLGAAVAAPASQTASAGFLGG